jgi:transposase
LSRRLRHGLGINWRVSGKSRTAEELRYGLNHWEGLVRFLDDGRIELDTNIVERGVPIVLNRKNALFASHDEGAKNSACVASLIETCKLHNVEPQAYIVGVLDGSSISGLPPASTMLMP